MRVHRDADQRSRGTTCGQTFAASTGTPVYRWHTAADWVTVVLTLGCHGCPIQAMVAAFGLDERTVAAWVARAGQPCQQVPQHVGQPGQVDLPHVQADALWVTLVGRRVWMALALAVPSRRWLGGVLSAQRDVPRITTLVPLLRSCARTLAILVCVDGWASHVTAVLRVVRGTKTALAAVLATTHTGTGIKTADIERLNATCRASLAPLVRRGRAIAHTETVLTAGMWLVGWADHCCWLQQSLRLAAPAGAPWKWQERTPAMAAGLTEHRWTMLELMRSQGPLPAWVAPTRRGRPPTRRLQPAMAAAA